MGHAILEANLERRMSQSTFKSWIKANKEVFTIIGAIVGSVIWMTTSLHNMETELSKEIGGIKEELIKIETVLILRGIAPPEMFSVEGER